jgi:putative RecB family exonuclease
LSFIAGKIVTYHISATKLQTYKRCPYAYYLRYERRVSSNDFYGSAVLGTALHQALAQCHRDWHYHDAIPEQRWLHRCWEEHSSGLTPNQVQEGRSILEGYYDRFIAGESVLRKPLAVEGKIQARLQVENVEFAISGRYDRIDYLPDGLELIDYKSSREMKLPDNEEIDLQLGLYYLALEQTYGQSLQYLSLLFLRSGEKIRFRASDKHRQKVVQVITELARQIRSGLAWEPTPGDQCRRCGFARYCAAVNLETAVTPTGSAVASLQLALSL